MDNQHLALLRAFRGASPLDRIPTREDMAAHLAARHECVGETAFAEFSYLHKVAAEVWGPEATVHFARVLRDASVVSKPRDACCWNSVERQAGVLPEELRPRLLEQIALSRKGRAVLGRTIWSVDYTKSVLRALSAWCHHCHVKGISLHPTAGSLHGYACGLVDAGDESDPVTIGTAANYLQRILAGLAVATGGAGRSQACAFVAIDWRERAKGEAAATKTGRQLVGASALYTLGFRLIDEARDRPLRGVRAATIFRNGLILAVGTALPERARALTWLEFDRTLTLIGGPYIHVDLPGEALKYPEARKAQEGYDVVFENAGLAEALREYRADFRPLFDDGLHLFPSVHGKPGSIRASQLGALTGNLTEREFGVRIPLHRLRDNVATEASENLIGGAYAAKTLLRHVDESITRRHYDHSEGMKAAEEFEDFVEKLRTVRTELIL
jgi:integrase